MSAGGKLRVIVRSKKVPARTIQVARYVGVPFGASLRPYPGHAVLFEDVLDQEQLLAVEGARTLSCNLGLELEVVDIAKMNPLGRFLSGFIHGAVEGAMLEVSPRAAPSTGIRAKRPTSQVGASV